MTTEQAEQIASEAIEKRREPMSDIVRHHYNLKDRVIPSGSVGPWEFPKCAEHLWLLC
jgi:hypothetical protein